MIDIPQGTPPIVAMLVGEVRYYYIDTTNDGGLPSGTQLNQLTLDAKNEIDGTDAPSLVAGGLISITDNNVRIRITAATTGTYRIMLTYTNSNGQPCKCFWRFKIA